MSVGLFLLMSVCFCVCVCVCVCVFVCLSVCGGVLCVSHSEFNMKAKFTGHGRSFQQSLGERKNERKKERKRERKKEREKKKRHRGNHRQRSRNLCIPVIIYLCLFHTGALLCIPCCTRQSGAGWLTAVLTLAECSHSIWPGDKR